MNEFFSANESPRWMLVDDNAEVLKLLAAVLKNYTTAIIECHNSPYSALGAFAAAPDKYELVITDLEMPGMNGVELCRRLHGISARHPVFLATGSGHFNESAARRAGFSALLNKPFPSDALHEALASAGLAHETAYAASETPSGTPGELAGETPALHCAYPCAAA